MNKTNKKFFHNFLFIFFLILLTNGISIFSISSRNNITDPVIESNETTNNNDTDNIDPNDQKLLTLFTKTLLAANGNNKEYIENNTETAQDLPYYFNIKRYLVKEIKDDILTMEKDLKISPPKYGSRSYYSGDYLSPKDFDTNNLKTYYFVDFLIHLYENHPNLHIQSNAFNNKIEYQNWLAKKTVKYMLYQKAFDLSKKMISYQQFTEKIAVALYEKMSDIIKKFPLEKGYEIDEPILPKFHDEDTALSVDGLIELTDLIINSKRCKKQIKTLIINNMIKIASRWSGDDALNWDTWIDDEKQQKFYNKKINQLSKKLNSLCK